MRRFNLFSLALIVLLGLMPPAMRSQSGGRNVRNERSAGAPISPAAKAAPAAAAMAPSAAARRAAERITIPRLREHLTHISSDAMAGRDTPSVGLDETAKFLAGRLSKLKLRPAGDDGTYFQRITLSSTQVDSARTVAQLGERRFELGKDFLPGIWRSGEASGALVYAGHGWVIKSKNIDAYQGLDVRNKIVIISGNGTAPPPGVTLAEARALPAGDWESPISYAQKNGASGLILIPTRFERTWRFGMRSLNRTSFAVESPEEKEEQGQQQQAAAQLLPAIVPSTVMLSALFAGEKVGGPEILQATVAGNPVAGFSLGPDKLLRFGVGVSSSRAATQNVIAILEGSDPVLKKEYLAIGAHYDHVGVGREVNGDSIYNGADDDGSGTTAVLAMAEAFVRGPRPKRSILFIWHTGEEKGLWGSEYFTDHPTVPLKQIVAQLNIDMIGRSKKVGDTNPKNKMLTGPNEIYVIGSRVLSTELGDLNERLNRGYLNLDYNFHYDRPNDPEAMWTRSDHFNYARKGVPIIFYFDGVHEDYHQPSDTVDKIDFQKMLNITRTIFVLASEVANAPRRPVVDKELPAAARVR